MNITLEYLATELGHGNSYFVDVYEDGEIVLELSHGTFKCVDGEYYRTDLDAVIATSEAEFIAEIEKFFNK